mmetsp:Transcript_65151/g.155536  ORF Transcript_65151/g.155536 Transcript_65151/m.155536 type:complete len:249 (-) Transcript_65151:101-847(-)
MTRPRCTGPPSTGAETWWSIFSGKKEAVHSSTRAIDKDVLLWKWRLRATRSVFCTSFAATWTPIPKGRCLRSRRNGFPGCPKLTARCCNRSSPGAGSPFNGSKALPCCIGPRRRMRWISRSTCCPWGPIRMRETPTSARRWMWRSASAMWRSPQSCAQQRGVGTLTSCLSRRPPEPRCRPLSEELQRQQPLPRRGAARTPASGGKPKALAGGPQWFLRLISPFWSRSTSSAGRTCSGQGGSHSSTGQR